MSGQIHFVTPTNRWIGSIPLSTLDPLTLEPLSTYLRPDALRPPTNVTLPQNNGVGPSDISCGQDLNEKDNNNRDNVFKDRTTNIKVPAPPKHSDYYHAQHLLRLIFQTQKIRSRALKRCLPEYFDSAEDVTISTSSEDREEQEQVQPHVIESLPLQLPLQPVHTTIPIEGQIQQISSQAARGSKTSTKMKKKTPRYVHSLLLNRAVRNPLTNTEIEAKEEEKKEEGAEGAVQTENGPTEDVIQHEKRELRKARWRQERIMNLEIEAQHELEWRRWQRSLLVSTSTSTSSASASEDWRSKEMSGSSKAAEQLSRRQRPTSRNMRFRLSNDVTLLETSERGLRLPRRKREDKDSSEMDTKANDNTMARIATVASAMIDTVTPKEQEEESSATTKTSQAAADGTQLMNNNNDQAQTSSALEPMELQEIYRYHSDHQQQQLHQQEQRGAEMRTRLDDVDNNELEKEMIGVTTGRLPAQESGSMTTINPVMTIPSILPWWDPDPQPFKMPISRLSEFGISTLPEPVVKHFGGVSIYAASPSRKWSSQEQPHPEASVLDRQDQDEHESREEYAEDNYHDEHHHNVEPKKESKNNDKHDPLNCNRDGCTWIPRLLFRHLSQEDFEDRVQRVSRIPYALSTVIMEGGSQRQPRQHDQDDGGNDGMEIAGVFAEGSGGRSNRAHSSGSRERRDDEHEQTVEQEQVQEQQGSSSSPWNEARRRPRWMSRIFSRSGSMNDAQSMLDTTTTITPAVEAVVDSVAAQQQGILQDSSFVTLSTRDKGAIDEKSTDDECPEASGAVLVDPALDDEHLQQEERAVVPLDDKVDEKMEVREEEDAHETWALYQATFEREDYDSSDYAYSALDDDDDNSSDPDWDNSGIDSSDASSVSDDSSEEDEQAGSAPQGSSRRSLMGQYEVLDRLDLLHEDAAPRCKKDGVSSGSTTTDEKATSSRAYSATAASRTGATTAVVEAESKYASAPAVGSWRTVAIVLMGTIVYAALNVEGSSLRSRESSQLNRERILVTEDDGGSSSLMPVLRGSSGPEASVLHGQSESAEVHPPLRLRPQRHHHHRQAEAHAQREQGHSDTLMASVNDIMRDEMSGGPLLVMTAASMTVANSGCHLLQTKEDSQQQYHLFGDNTLETLRKCHILANKYGQACTVLRNLIRIWKLILAAEQSQSTTGKYNTRVLQAQK
ncbi:hypothetical protein BGX28_010433 [Mortierella sp. GBA30]|nr:hypothetical protein BGX28_010433 [Mortierella sp. GBA30]